jgi:hypothetical protein
MNDVENMRNYINGVVKHYQNLAKAENSKACLPYLSNGELIAKTQKEVDEWEDEHRFADDGYEDWNYLLNTEYGGVMRMFGAKLRSAYLGANFDAADSRESLSELYHNGGNEYLKQSSLRAMDDHTDSTRSIAYEVRKAGDEALREIIEIERR